MNTDSSQIEDKPIIEADLGENGGHVAFRSLEEAKNWIENEILQWETFRGQVQNSSVLAYVLQRQLELPLTIKDSLAAARSAENGERDSSIRHIGDLFGHYADYRSVCAKSAVGEMILTLPLYGFSLFAIGGLASILGMPAHDLLQTRSFEEAQFAIVLSGYAMGRSINVVRRSDLPRYIVRTERQLNSLQFAVKAAEEELDRFRKAEAEIRDEISEGWEKQKSDWGEFHGSAEHRWETLKATFEEDLHLRAPATYWHRRSKLAFRAWLGSLVVFLLGAAAIVGVAVVFGPAFLQELASVEGSGHFAILAFVSIPALTALWALRHVARLFVTNLERSGDAKLRETMATTFLALAKEGATEVDRDERLMILQALFRPPNPAPADDGHFGGALEILTRRSSQT